MPESIEYCEIKKAEFQARNLNDLIAARNTSEAINLLGRISPKVLRHVLLGKVNRDIPQPLQVALEHGAPYKLRKALMLPLPAPKDLRRYLTFRTGD